MQLSLPRSDEDLARRCKRNAVEDWFHRSGCFAGLVAGLSASVAMLSTRVVGVISWSWLLIVYLAALAFFLIALCVFTVFEFVARFRGRHVLRELEARYGCRPLGEYVREAKHSAKPNELLIVLLGRGLPHGDNWWVCVRVLGGGKLGSVEVRSGSFQDDVGGSFDFGKGRVPATFFKIVKADLSASAAERLAQLAEQVHGRRTTIKSTVLDGFPVRCAVLYGHAKGVETITCNLAGIPQSEAEQPHVQLVEEVFAAANALIDREKQQC